MQHVYRFPLFVVQLCITRPFEKSEWLGESKAELHSVAS